MLLRRSGEEIQPCIDRLFQMIDSVQMPVIIAIDEESTVLLRDLEHAKTCGAIARKLQPYLIQIPREVHRALATNGAIQPVCPERYDTQFMQLVVKDLYSDRYGLLLNGSISLDAASLVL